MSEKKPKRRLVLLTSLAKLEEVLSEEIAEGRNPTTPKDWQRVMDLMVAYDMVDAIIPVESDINADHIKEALPDLKIKNLKDL